MTTIQSVLTIAAVAAGTMLTRFLPFILFPEGKTPPACITYLGKVLPDPWTATEVVGMMWSAAAASPMPHASGRRGMAQLWEPAAASVRTPQAR